MIGIDIHCQDYPFVSIVALLLTCTLNARRYDDYDYGEVNHLLARELKLYIKAVACCPDATKSPLCPLPWAMLKPSERVRMT